ncbi:MAG: ParB/Srx family N-terminal domain-containing protein [bacterium]
MRIVENFETKKVCIDNIFLDPNNPRFLDLYNEPPVSYDLSIIQKRQDIILGRMIEGNFDIEELIKSISTSGFLPIDRIVVMKIDSGIDKYVIIEGNRRAAAIKTILKESEFYEPSLVDNLKEIEVIILNSDAKNPELLDIGKQVVQGVRNVTGIKSWGPYQQAQFIDNMIKAGEDAGTIGKMIGMPATKINKLWKTFNVLNQMRNDEVYAELWDARLFAYFDQIIGRPLLRDDWLGWDREKGIFTKRDNLEFFYTWIVGGKDEEGNPIPKKISDHRHVAYLEKAVSNPEALNELKRKDKTIEDIIPMISEQKTSNWWEDVHRGLKAVSDIGIDEVEKFSEENIQLLKDTIIKIQQRLTQYGKLKK